MRNHQNVRFAQPTVDACAESRTTHRPLDEHQPQWEPVHLDTVSMTSFPFQPNKPNDPSTSGQENQTCLVFPSPRFHQTQQECQPLLRLPCPRRQREEQEVQVLQQGEDRVCETRQNLRRQKGRLVPPSALGTNDDWFLKVGWSRLQLLEPMMIST